MLLDQQNYKPDTRREQLPGYYQPVVERCSYCLGSGSIGTRRSRAVYDLVYDSVGSVVRIGGPLGSPITMTPNELRIMRQLLRHPGAIIPYRTLAIGVFGSSWVDATKDWDHVLRVNITRVRKQLAPWLRGGRAEALSVIFTHMHVGYVVPRASDAHGLGFAEALMDLPDPMRYQLAMQLLSKPFGVEQL